MSARVVGYYVAPMFSNDKIKKVEEDKLITRAGAINKAKELLGITGRNYSKVGVIRANDMVLLYTLSVNKQKGIVLDKHK